MTLLRTVYGKPPPLIMRPRLRLVRTVHLKLRFAIQSLFRRERSLPRYWHTHMTDADAESVRDACMEFIGGHSADPVIAHEHKMRSWKALLESPTCPEELKKQMQAAGPPKAPDPREVPDDPPKNSPTAETPTYKPAAGSPNGRVAPTAPQDVPAEHQEVPVSG